MVLTDFFLKLAVLLAFSAFFSGSETAFFSLSKVRVKRLQLDNIKNAKTLAWLLDRPKRLIMTILIGNMLVNTLASSTSSSLCLVLFGDRGVLVSIFAMTAVILIFGEITPKVIAMKNSEKIALAVAPYLKMFFRLIMPLRKVLRAIVYALLGALGSTKSPGAGDLTKDEFRKALELGRREGELDVREEEMLKGVFRFHDRVVRDVMMPLSRIVAADVRTPSGTICSIIKNNELSRMPIFEDKLDNILGMLYAKDLIVSGLKGPFAIRDILRKPFYVCDKMKLKDLLREFRVHRMHMALVRNTSGRLAGLVTLQDLLEEIVGQIRDVKAS